MAYDIYTYGNGEILKGVFDAVAMCLNSRTGSLYESLKMLGLIVGAFWGTLYLLYGDQMKAFTHWILPMTIVMNLLFVPTESVWIHDPVTRYHQKVDHVPYGLAAFAGHVSKIGHHITEQVEKIFTLPDDLRYQKSGAIFASNILIQAKTFHITNEDVAENMRGFVGQCILYDAMLGRKYSIQELRQSDDIWGLVSRNASPVRSFLWRDPKKEGYERGRPEIITCQEGVQRFNRLWGPEMHQAAALFGRKIFGKNALISARDELLKYLPLSYQALGDIAKSATDILKQNMMIYAVVDGLESQSAALGNAPNFAARRAYLQQRSTYETLGAMVGDTLPSMKAVLEAIAYACFIFMVPLAILPFGWRFLMKWGQIILWLQMWAPLYAILNYVMTMAARGKNVAIISASNEAGVTLASAVGISNINADIQAMAGYLAMSIPFLSIAILKGVGAFVHLSSHLGNITQSAAGTAAHDATTGNYSFGNVSEGNTQVANTNMLSHNRAAIYKAGGFQMQDGRTDITTMADGSHIVNVGTSNLPISINAAESLSDQQSTMATQAYQRGVGLSESSSEHLASSSRRAVQLSQALGRMESRGDSASMNMSTEQSHAIHRGAQLVEDFAHQNNVSTDKAANILGEASVGLGLGKNALSLSGKGSVNANDQELYQKAHKFAEDHNFQQAMREASNASKQLSHNLNDESSKRLAEDLSGSFEKGMNQRQEASKSFHQSDAYTTQAMLTRANSTTINRNASQEFVDWMAEQPAENAKGRLGHRGSSHIIASHPEQAFAYAEHFMAQKGLLKAPRSPEESLSATTMQAPPLRQDYESDESTQRYSVDMEAIDAVYSKGQSFLSTASKERMSPTPFVEEPQQSPSKVPEYHQEDPIEWREKDEEHSIKSEAPFIDRSLRDDVDQLQYTQQKTLTAQTQEILLEGYANKNDVMKQQNKGVVRRLGSKGISEVKEMTQDVWNSAKKIIPGESQQK